MTATVNAGRGVDPAVETGESEGEVEAENGGIVTEVEIEKEADPEIEDAAGVGIEVAAEEAEVEIGGGEVAAVTEERTEEDPVEEGIKVEIEGLKQDLVRPRGGVQEDQFLRSVAWEMFTVNFTSGI